MRHLHAADAEPREGRCVVCKRLDDRDLIGAVDKEGNAAFYIHAHHRVTTVVRAGVGLDVCPEECEA